MAPLFWMLASERRRLAALGKARKRGRRRREEDVGERQISAAWEFEWAEEQEGGEGGEGGREGGGGKTDLDNGPAGRESVIPRFVLN